MLLSRSEAIGRSLSAIRENRTTFEEAFAQLRAAAERRRLEKERAKWLAEDRRAFTQEEQALISRILRGRASEVLVRGFNSELTRFSCSDLWAITGVVSYAILPASSP